jgi:hypothetical protein
VALSEAVMGRIALRLSILGAAIALAACDQQAMLEKIVSPAEQVTAKTFIDQLRHHDFGEIEKAADASIAGPSLDSTLDKMAALMPPGPPISVTLVGAHRLSSTAAGSIVNLTFEYHFPERYVIANLATKLKNGQLSIVGFHVYPERESLETQNRFKWAGKSALDYAVLAYGIAVALFTLVVVVVAAKTKMRRRKWLWILFILFGVGKFSVNWATGQWGIAFLALQLFSASSHAEFFGPWIISVSLPIGAILFLLRRSRLRALDEERAAVEA